MIKHTRWIFTIPRQILIAMGDKNANTHTYIHIPIITASTMTDDTRANAEQNIGKHDLNKRRLSSMLSGHDVRHPGGGELGVLRVRKHPLNVEVHPLTAKSTPSK